MPEPTLLIIWRLKSWPVPVGQEKRSNGGAARSQISACRVCAGQGPAAGDTRARGDGPRSRRAAAGGVFQRAAEPELVFQSIQFTRSRRTAAAAASGRQ